MATATVRIKVRAKAVRTEWDSQEAVERSTRAARKQATSGKRRKIDPTTCERDYTPAEVQFMNAMHAYKQRSGRMFPTWSEVLEVLTGLGYTQPAGAAKAA